jgi:dipeptidyl-peptidase-3
MNDERDTNRRGPEDFRKIGELERLGPGGREILVLGVGAQGFERLPTDRKVFAYYLYRAAIAGNDILYAQSHRDAFEIKRLLESIFVHSQGMHEDLKRAVHEYLKCVWIHHGQYNHYTHTKYLPILLTTEKLREAAEHAAKNGAVIERRSGETLRSKLDRLNRSIFDPDFEPIQTNQSENTDIVAGSAVNFWDAGVTEKDLAALPDSLQHKINVRFARKNGDIVPEVFKIGGLFSRELETISHFLRLAVPLAEGDDQRRSIELLLDFYTTGDEETFRDHSVHWLKSDPTVDYLNGFIEQYTDPRGIIGAFEGNVSYKSDAELVSRIADNALYFEERMPWPDRFKRSAIEPPVAQVVDVLVETGDAGPVSPAAYNLPNYNDLRRDHGSKNVILHNIENTRSASLLEKMINEFYLPEYRENVFRYFHTKARPLKVYMHEIIGHGSGQPDPELGSDPRTALGRVYTALEESRADLVALYHISDPKLVEIGAFEADEQAAIVETAYITQTQGWMTRYDHVIGMQVREAHNKGNQLILMYVVENGGDPTKDFGLDVVRTGGRFFVKIRDIEKVRTGWSELLDKLQTIKSTGDYRAAAALFDRFGTHVNPEWYRDIVGRLEALNVPKMKAFVFPRLAPVIEDGRVTDVRIHHDEDLTAQQLRFSRLQNVTDITPLD